MKKWQVLNKMQNAKCKMQNEEIIRILLTNRGIKTKKEQEEFLNPPVPHVLTPKSLNIDQKEVSKAVKRIQKAIKSGEKIIVYGDYDADGVCATAILWQTLDILGAKAMPFIPTRDEGYGMKVERIEEFVKEGVTLIITVDNGIVAYEQGEHAKKAGVDLIITDHHLIGRKKPKAFAIIHSSKLSGAGVSWFLADRLGKPSLDLVTIGTVADLMPLAGPNRSIVYWGLDQLRKTKNPGLKELFKVAGIEPEGIGTYEIGFIIAPRINAAGRMEDPMDALRLICTRSQEKATALAGKLDQQNRQRQALMDEVTLHARDLWLKEDGKSSLIFVSHEAWEHGIVGLVAGKLVEEFYRPAIVVAWGKEYCRASARSISGFDIVSAIRKCADILGPHGGHSMAAGFTVETPKLFEVKQKLQVEAEKIDKELLSPTIKVDTEIDLSWLSLDLYNNIQKLEPFGLGNPEPVFATAGVFADDARLVGRDSRHLSLMVRGSSSNLRFRAIGFSLGNLFSQISSDKPIDVAFCLSLNEWNNNKQLELRLRDIKINL